MYFSLPRKGERSFWLYLLVLGFAVIGYVAGQLPLTLVLMSKVGFDDKGDDAISNFQRNPDFSMFGIDQNVGLALLLFSFVGLLTFLVLGVKYILRRNPLSLITSKSRIDWKKIGQGFALWFAFTVILELVAMIFQPESYTFQFRPGPFFGTLLIALFILPIQTTAEEIIFRGFIMQYTGFITRLPWLGWIIASCLFAVVHAANPEVIKYGLPMMMMYYLTAGLFLGAITILDDSLELALGVHFATNFFGVVLLNYEGGALQTAALYSTHMNIAWPAVIMFILTSAFFIGLMGYIFKWRNVIEKFTRIEDEVPLV
jgi:membrane protease YdiL (CAAX protease family)